MAWESTIHSYICPFSKSTTQSISEWVCEGVGEWVDELVSCCGSMQWVCHCIDAHCVVEFLWHRYDLDAIWSYWVRDHPSEQKLQGHRRKSHVPMLSGFPRTLYLDRLQNAVRGRRELKLWYEYSQHGEWKRPNSWEADNHIYEGMALTISPLCCLRRLIGQVEKPI